MSKISTTGFLTLFSALVLTSMAYKFFPDPYNRDNLKLLGLSNEEINKRMLTYFIIGLILLLVTTSLFYKAISHSRV